MKIAELTGAELDFWVAKAENASDNVDSGAYVAFARMEKWGETWEEQQAHPNHRFAPSSDWEHGGPIIERERIAIATADTVSITPRWLATMGQVWAHDGQTPLIAAMRAYVASKYGESVPDEKGNQ